jgi:putative transposase
MGQSLVHNYVHIVFSTKHRKEFIEAPHEQELYKYISAICLELNVPVLAINGYKDHIHILIMLPSKIALMKVVEKIKSSSSKWYKTKHANLINFYWQNGYGAFAVSPRHVDQIKGYIAKQHKHHQKISFQNEYREMLNEFNIEYNELYVWD